MENNTKDFVKGAGYFFGAAAYGFTHAPAIIVGELKRKRRNKRAYKRAKELQLEYTAKLQAGVLSKEEDDRLTKEFLDAVHEFRDTFR